MSNSSLKVPTDIWLKATWDKYLQAIEQCEDEKAKGYYCNNRMRIEMSPVGNPHARDHAIIIHAVVLYAGIKGLDLNGFDNCTYRKTGCNEAQPDASFYIGESVSAIDWDITIVDLDRYSPPTLAIEIAYTSISDDKGEKRLLYEAIGVSEYWIIDVQNVEVIAFSVANGGSRRITQSQVLPRLEIALLEEAFRRSRRSNHGKVSAWLLRQWQTGEQK